MNGYQYLALFLGALALLSLVTGASYAAAGVWEGRWIGYVVNGVIMAICFVIIFAYGSSRGAESKRGIDETKRLLEQLKNKDDLRRRAPTARYVEYLAKLEDLKSRGEMSEETYLKLKKEFSEKLEQDAG